MDVGFDQAGAGEAPTRVIALGRIAETAPERDDPAAGDADIQHFPRRPIGEPGVAYDQIHPEPFVDKVGRGPKHTAPPAMRESGASPRPSCGAAARCYDVARIIRMTAP